MNPTPGAADHYTVSIVYITDGFIGRIGCCFYATTRGLCSITSTLEASIMSPKIYTRLPLINSTSLKGIETERACYLPTSLTRPLRCPANLRVLERSLTVILCLILSMIEGSSMSATSVNISTVCRYQAG